ncbi:MAG: peptidylprolyl isomerase [Alphaproteobacteria bacterium]|nr:peptidylprolyl isomerase [Alphaproteobacteria bacterium]
MLMRIIRDPLAHFLVLGGALFMVFAALNADGGNAGKDDNRILVNRDVLLTFIQYRSKAFQPEVAAAELDKLSGEDLQQLIDDYVREEALYREAQSLGLDADDYIIKRRMIQKVDFITQGFAEATIEVGDDEVEAYYLANKETYREDGLITFTHVFFDSERRSLDEAKALAEAKLAELRAIGAAFSDAPKHGERFPYGVNYVERTRAHVESHVGAEMTEALFAEDAADGLWQGPFTSPFGVHLAMIVMKQPSRLPALDEVRPRIEADLEREQQRERSALAEKVIIDRYDVDIQLGDDTKALARLDEKR